MPEVTDPAILGQLNGPRKGGFTGYIPASPKDPVKMEREQVDLERARADMQRDRERIGLDQEKAARDRADFENKQRQLQASGGVDASVDQGKAAAFAKRAVASMAAYEGAGLDPDSMVGQWGNQTFPSITAMASSDRRNAVRGMEKEFIAAVLRYDSGAAIPPSEFESAYQIYFPSSSAGPEEIAQKARARKTAVEGLMIGAGPAAARVGGDQPQGGNQDRNGAIPGAGNASGGQPPLAGLRTDQVENTLDQALMDDSAKGYRFTPAQESALREYLTSPNANAKDYAAMMSGFAAAQGVAVDDAYRQSAEANGQRILSQLAKGAKLAPGGVSYAQSDKDYRDSLLREYDAQNPRDQPLDKLQERGDDISRAATQGVTFNLSDEAKGLAGMLTGEGYEKARDRERALNDRFSQESPGTAIAANLVGNLVVPAGAFGATARASTLGGRVAQGAKIGAKAGALSGFGSGEGGASVPNAVIGGALGGAIGGALPIAGEAVSRARGALSRNAVAPTVDADAIAAAGMTENVPVNRAMVAPELANKVTGAEASALGGPIIRGKMQGVSEAIEGRVGALGGTGTKLDPAVAGEVIQGAADRFIKGSKKVVDRAYKRAGDMAGGTKVTPSAALSEIDSQLADLNNAPETNKAVIDFLTSLKSDLANGNMSIDTLRQIRTGVRGKISASNLTFSDAERRAGLVLDKASQDIESALGSNPQGLAAYRLADKRYKERSDYIREILKPVLGPRDNALSPEKALAKVETWARPKGDAGRLAALWKSLTPEEAADLATTRASELGRDSAGNFSPALLIGQADKMSKRARLVYFGKEGVDSIENLLTLSNAYRRVTDTYNKSKSAVGMNNGFKAWLVNAFAPILTGGVGAASTGSAGGTMAGVGLGAAVVGGGMAKSALSAKALMSPKITRWITNAPNTRDPKVIDEYFARLSTIAARQPSVQGEVEAIRTMIMDAARNSPRQAIGKEDSQTETQ